MKPACIDCSEPTSGKGKTGRCKSCSTRRLTSDPAANERRLAGMRKRFAEPEIRARRSAKALARYAKPEERKKTADAIRAALAANPDKHRAAALVNLVEARKVDTAKQSGATRKANYEASMAWCPADRRAEYVRLRKARGGSAAEAKRIILADIAAQERRRKAAMSPFERQLEAVRSGAGLVSTFNPRRADPSYTLGGVVGAIA